LPLQQAEQGTQVGSQLVKLFQELIFITYRIKFKEPEGMAKKRPILR
jgi:hypothetical protein